MPTLKVARHHVPCPSIDCNIWGNQISGDTRNRDKRIKRILHTSQCTGVLVPYLIAQLYFVDQDGRQKAQHSSYYERLCWYSIMKQGSAGDFEWILQPKWVCSTHFHLIDEFRALSCFPHCAFVQFRGSSAWTRCWVLKFAWTARTSQVLCRPALITNHVSWSKQRSESWGHGWHEAVRLVAFVTLHLRVHVPVVGRRRPSGVVRWWRRANTTAPRFRVRPHRRRRFPLSSHFPFPLVPLFLQAHRHDHSSQSQQHPYAQRQCPRQALGFLWYVFGKAEGSEETDAEDEEHDAQREDDEAGKSRVALGDLGVFRLIDSAVPTGIHGSVCEASSKNLSFALTLK